MTIQTVWNARMRVTQFLQVFYYKLWQITENLTSIMLCTKLKIPQISNHRHDRIFSFCTYICLVRDF